MRYISAALLFIVVTASSAVAQEAIYMIRHGEKELSGTDPALTPEGRLRAADWAVMLQYAGIDAICTSDALRTRETGAIIADALGLQADAMSRDDTAGLIDVLEFDHEEDTVLIVAHAETIPQILESVGILEDIEIDQGEFANLFVVISPSSGDMHMFRFMMP